MQGAPPCLPAQYCTVPSSALECPCKRPFVCETHAHAELSMKPLKEVCATSSPNVLVVVLQDCSWTAPDGNCSTKERYPGLWQVPLWDLQVSPRLPSSQETCSSHVPPFLAGHMLR